MVYSMHNKPRVSVIVLGYNEERFLEDCLAAVLDQDYPQDQYEVLFIDNGSSDGSLELVQERFPEVRAISLDRNYGFGGGNNRGAAHARSDLVVFFNADTVAHRGWLSGLVRAMDNDPQVKACAAADLAPDLPGFEAMEREALPAHVYYADIVRFGHVGLNRIRSDAPPRNTLHLAGCTAMLDLSILDELEYIFDENFFLDGDDTDLGFRINSLGYKKVVVPDALFYHLAKTVPTDLKPSGRTLQRMVRMHRNRFIAYYRNMHTAEFLLALPVLLLGSPLKPFTFKMGLGRKLAYAAAIVPVTWYAFAQALLIHFPRHAEKRRRILQRRRREPFWFLKQILRRKHYNE
jgi:GT2 family glycosyltransferase